MGIRRRCRGGCRTTRRCLEHLWFDVTYRGTRYRMPVNEFAVPRMQPGQQRPVESIEEARDWERLFIGEIKGGRDPRNQPVLKLPETDLKHVAGFLDAYFERQVRPAALRSIDTVRSRIKVLKAYFGELPIKSLEEAETINRFKSDSEYADEVEIATLHKVLATLRAAIHWGQAQRPALIEKSPFHRFGVRLNKKAETSRPHYLSGRGEATPGRSTRDEHLGTSVRRSGYARPHRRRARALLPARRDVAHSEQTGALGDASDRHPRPDHEGQGEPSHSV
jgi:hypothetical protein